MKELYKEDMQIREVPLTEELLEQLIRLSEDWEAEESCHGYRKNERADIEGNRIFVVEAAGNDAAADGGACAGGEVAGSGVCAGDKAAVGGEVLAYLFGHAEEAKNSSSVMPDGTPFFEVEELYVQPELRSQGIGRKLFAHVEEVLKKEGACKFILLSTATKNWKAILHFYIEELDMEFWNARLFKEI